MIVDGLLQENQLFNSPSYATGFVLGMHTNGRTDWKDRDGRTLKELEETVSGLVRERMEGNKHELMARINHSRAS